VITFPHFAKAYVDLVRRLEDVLRQPEPVQRAHETLATMIEKVVLTPDKLAEDELRAEIHGKLANVLNVCGAAGSEGLSADLLGPESQLSMVAGEGVGLWRTRPIIVPKELLTPLSRDLAARFSLTSRVSSAAGRGADRWPSGDKRASRGALVSGSSAPGT
jgi:hypothetical protein